MRVDEIATTARVTDTLSALSQETRLEAYALKLKKSHSDCVLLILNPYAAKRLWTILGAILKEYESRFGPLSLEGVNTQAGKNSAAKNSS